MHRRSPAWSPGPGRVLASHTHWQLERESTSSWLRALFICAYEVYVSKNNAMDPQEGYYYEIQLRREREGHAEMKNKGVIHFW